MLNSFQHLLKQSIAIRKVKMLPKNQEMESEFKKSRPEAGKFDLLLNKCIL
jgi:hypothetical protein